MHMSPRALAAFLVLSSVVVGCSAETEEPDTAEAGLSAKVEEHWFYTGKLPRLTDAAVTLSLKVNTARVSGELPAGYPADLSGLPHVRRSGDHVDIVYPVANAANLEDDSPANEVPYKFHAATPYKPHANAVTVSNPTPHWVTWGGFPFLAYNGGIAFHGPITCTGGGDCNAASEQWYLRRGRVSGGCNRMLGEHVVELAHVLGVSMRKVYSRSKVYRSSDLAALGPSSFTATGVTVTNDYDTLDGKYVDVDYPTDDDAPLTRPGAVHGAAAVVMFGSWVATEVARDAPLRSASDLPPDMSGLGGRPYVFAQHARRDTVCSYPPSTLKALENLAATLPGKELPMSLCQSTTRRCVIERIAATGDGLNVDADAAIDVSACFGASMHEGR